jgi:hypothetical protein
MIEPSEVSPEFGDYENEDAWDAGDGAREMAINLLRRLDLLDRSRRGDELDDLIGDIETRLDAYRRVYEQLGDRDRLRVDQIIEDLPTLRDRARHGS